MKNVFRSILVATIAALLVASASIPSDAASRAARTTRAFDGVWSVVIYTLYGDCDRSLRYSLRIADGQVLANEQSYQVAGLVAPNGIIRVVVAEGGRSASGSGKLSGNNGKGEWRTSTGQCAGQWTAVRRPNAEY
jgi:hypothetical protein